jgi:chlorobactene glucosyltransferase
VETGFIYNLQLGVLIFLLALALNLLTNRMILPCLETFREQQNSPLISVLLPVRNEVHQIRRCLESLLAQEYGAYELFVLDDESDDGTAEIFAELAAKHPRLKVLKGAPLPDGWVGKTWACHQLSLQARGSYLLFTDADTIHEPGMLSRAASAMQALSAGLMTGLPHQLTETMGEKLILPLLTWVVYGLTPLALVRLFKPAFLATGVGQFMFFTRQAYDLSGGHASVRASLIEDIELSRKIQKHRLGWRLVNISSLVSCRMYRDTRSALRGFARTLYPAFGGKPLLFGFIWLWLLYLFLQPVVLLILHTLGVYLPGFSTWTAAACVLLSFGLWLAVDLWYHHAWYQALLYPLTILLFTAIAARSAYDHLWHRQTSWKGRTVRVKSPPGPKENNVT